MLTEICLLRDVVQSQQKEVKLKGERAEWEWTVWTLTGHVFSEPIPKTETSRRKETRGGTKMHLHQVLLATKTSGIVFMSPSAPQN